MPFPAVPAAAISEAEVESVVDFLQRPRLVIVHTGPIGSKELLGSESRSARHTRASLASAVGDVQFPTVHIEPGGRRNGSDFYMLAVLGTPSLLDRLLLRPGAQARVVQGRTVSVTVSVTIPVFREADDATADGAKGKGCGKAKGKGKGKGKGAGGGGFPFPFPFFLFLFLFLFFLFSFSFSFSFPFFSFSFPTVLPPPQLVYPNR